MSDVKVGQFWRRKRDGVLVKVTRGRFGPLSFVMVRNQDTGRAFEVSEEGLARNYEPGSFVPSNAEGSTT